MNDNQDERDLDPVAAETGEDISETAQTTDTQDAKDAAPESESEESFKNKYLRALADYQNLLKVTAQEKQEFYKYALASFLEDLLPVYDNLKMSVANLSEAESKSPWVEGVKYVLKQFQDILTGRGLEEIRTVGEVFDHNTMEALEGQGDKVIKEVRPGYKLNGRVLTPAKVIVGEN